MKKLYLLAIVLLSLILFSCEGDNYVAVTGVANVRVGTGFGGLVVGNTEEVSAQVFPHNATNLNATWESSNPEIVSVVSSGGSRRSSSIGGYTTTIYATIKILSLGTATITVTTQDGSKTATHTINVGKGQEGTITWRISNDTLIIGGVGRISGVQHHRPWERHRDFFTALIVEDGVTSIVSDAFTGFTNLTSVTIGNGVLHIGSRAFLDCVNLTYVTIGNNVRDIDGDAFRNTGLVSIVIPRSVNTIWMSAFRNTKLTSVTFNAGSSIREHAFAENRNLNSITILSANPPHVTNINAFLGVPATVCLFVPEVLISVYRQHNVWRSFGCVVGLPIVVHTVTFNTQGGSFSGWIPTIRVFDGYAIESPTPFRFGFDFGGWYRESNHINVWNFETDVVTSDITLYARWTPV